jgi:hypothetical protein
MGTWLMIVVLVGLAVWSLWVGIVGWNLDSGVEMSGHGYAAMGLGVALTVIVGIGLMALLFYSSRSGHDVVAHEGGHRDDTD